MDRLSLDSTVPASLRVALQRAGGEKAPRDVLERVLGGTALGAGAAALTLDAGARGSVLAPALLRASVAAKGMAAVAIFLAGGVAGGYVVHAHDVRQAPSVPRPPTTAHVASVLAPPPVERAMAPVPPAEPEPPQVAPLAVAVPEAPAVAPRAHPGRRAETRSPVESPAPAAEASFAPPVVPTEPSHAPVHPSSREELAGLRAIRDDVTHSRGADALAAIDAYRQRFPEPVFAEELLFLEAEARSALADPAACSLLDRFAATHPTSLLLPRARALRASARCPEH